MTISGDRFRSRAIECIEAADATADPGRKLALVELAQRWLNLAAQVEAMDGCLRGDALLGDPKPTSH
jgi:hypothetical protein